MRGKDSLALAGRALEDIFHRRQTDAGATDVQTFGSLHTDQTTSSTAGSSASTTSGTMPGSFNLPFAFFATPAGRGRTSGLDWIWCFSDFQTRWGHSGLVMT